MLTNYLENTQSLERLRSCVVGPFIDEFLKRLEAAKYARSSIRAYLATAAHLGVWARRHHLTANDLDEGAGKRFLAHLHRCHCLRRNHGKYSDVPAQIRFFIHCLEEIGIVRTAQTSHAQKPESVLIDFCDWMQQNRGVAAGTLSNYRYVLKNLLRSVDQHIEQLNVHSIRAFVLEWADQHAKGTLSTVTATLRMFLRYLSIEGKCRPGLDECVPSIANWRLSSLPRYLEASDVEQVIASCNVQTKLGARNRAIILLLARLGLRAGDVISLRLKDIDWNQATIRVAGKGRREVMLPLTQEIGDALLQYLQWRRDPLHENDHFFVSDRAPLRPLSAHGTVSVMVARALRHAGVHSPVRGAHVLRHSAATTMLRQGVSLQAISALLRHRSIETTEIYAKVDTRLLRLVAQPWPEVRSC